MEGTRRRGRLALSIHAGLVAIAAGLFLVVALSWNEDANIGAGLVGLPLIALGLPWSLPLIIDPYRFDQLAGAWSYALVIGPAVANVVLHALARILAERRAGRTA